MNYPENLVWGDYIGICAPSGGISDPEKIKKLDIALDNLRDRGYRIIETNSVRHEERGRSAPAKVRAEEFMSLLENDKIKLIIFATGGDFLCEILEYLDFEKIKKLKPKWLQGYSDITGINFLWNTILEIPTMYCQTIKDYAMNPLFRNLEDALKIESGEEIVQNSFELYEKEWNEISNDFNYNLTEKVEWENIKGGKEVEFEGRSLGGNLECIRNLIGTKYDKVKEFIDIHKFEGIVWFLEVFEMTTPEVFRTLWQMENAGYFKYTKGIIFGRPLFIREDYDTSFNQAVYDAFNKYKFPIICGADIGHVAPQLAMVSGARLKITSKDGKGTVQTYLK